MAKASKSNSSDAKRTLNVTPKTHASGSPFNDQDSKRRLGKFTSAGEHARQGGRTTGIVGQTKQKNRTDKYRYLPIFQLSAGQPGFYR